MPATRSPTGKQVLNVLLVEDDERLVAGLRPEFQARHMVLHHAGTLAHATRLLRRPDAFDAIILDLNLPDGNGITLADACRLQGLSTPIIIVTARDAVDDRINGLSHGADDYICKPFVVGELIARLNAVWRRARRPRQHLLRYGDLELDLITRCVRRGEMDVPLSTRELDLLVYFLLHPEVVLEKERILHDVWGDGAERDDNLLQVYANYLRNKVEGGRYPRLIHTVRGVGYVLSEDEPNV
jgi:two-component system response regulator MprA